MGFLSYLLIIFPDLPIKTIKFRAKDACGIIFLVTSKNKVLKPVLRGFLPRNGLLA
jgi:hypothetical protein